MGAAEKGEVFCQPIRGWVGRRIYFSLMHRLSLMFQMDFTVQLHRDSEDQNHQKWERTGHLVAALGQLILAVGYSGFSYALDFQIRAFVCTWSCFLLFCVLQHRAGCPAAAGSRRAAVPSRGRACSAEEPLYVGAGRRLWGWIVSPRIPISGSWPNWHLFWSLQNLLRLRGRSANAAKSHIMLAGTLL